MVDVVLDGVWVVDAGSGEDGVEGAADVLPGLVLLSAGPAPLLGLFKSGLVSAVACVAGLAVEAGASAFLLQPASAAASTVEVKTTLASVDEKFIVQFFQ